MPRSACSTTAGMQKKAVRARFLISLYRFVNVTTLPGGKRRMYVDSRFFCIFDPTVTSSLGTLTQKNRLVLCVVISMLPSTAEIEESPGADSVVRGCVSLLYYMFSIYPQSKPRSRHGVRVTSTTFTSFAQSLLSPKIRSTNVIGTSPTM